MARKTNVTGIKKLSIGSTKNDKGGLLTRYSVNYKIGDKAKCKSFYFGVNKAQFNAYIEATNFMLENGLIELSNENIKSIYHDFNHEKLV
jgi:hypothetical protein